MPATYEPIATTTLSSAQNRITFSSIPSTYTDLRLVVVAAYASGSSSADITFNNDSSSLYSLTTISGSGTAASSNRATSQTRIIYPYMGNLYTNTPFSLITLDLFSYTSSVNKSCLLTAYTDNNGSGYVESAVALYRSTSSINRIDLAIGAIGTWSTGSTFTLYGILKA